MRTSPVVALLPFTFCSTLLAQGGPAPSSVSLLAGWNVEFSPPAGWRVARTVGRVQMLASSSEPGSIFIAPGLYTSAEEAISDLTALYTSMNLMAVPVEQPAQALIAGLRATVATYDSQDQTMRHVRARFINLLGAHGTGLNLLAMTTPEHFDRLRYTLERLAATVQVGAPIVNQAAVEALSGTWVLSSRERGPDASSAGGARAHDESIAFDGRGAFHWRSSPLASADGRIAAASPFASAGGVPENGDHGRYVVIGNTLILRGQKGQFTFDVALDGNRLIALGRTYVRP
ncbi:MAG: hypothetical protein ACREON_17665 [Gemmatimonadaceae bacterium]